MIMARRTVSPIPKVASSVCIYVYTTDTKTLIVPVKVTIGFTIPSVASSSKETWLEIA